MERPVYYFRTGVIIAAIAAVVVLYAATLYKLQVVEGANYYEQSQSSIVSASTVKASRGSILDRYGRVLVSNRSIYNIEIDYLAVRQTGRANDIFLELIYLAAEMGYEHTDGLPVSMEPFIYTPGMTGTQEYRLTKYFEYFNMSAETTAEELIEFLRDHYKIPEEMSANDARLVAGIRFELELRTVINIPAYVFVEDAGVDIITVLAENSYPGISVVTTSKREYHTPYAAHILGQTGPLYEEEYEYYKQLGYPMDALVGKNGIEKAMEEYLHGVDGTVVTTTTATGRVTDILYSTPPEPGGNVVLSIDIGLQEVAERALKSTIESLRDAPVTSTAGADDIERSGTGKDVEGGAAVVIKVDTGEVLAAANYPTFDLSTFNEDFDELKEDSLSPILNRAMQGLYAPGSTFKPLTAVAALQDEVITPSTIIRDQGRYTFYDSYQPTCLIYSRSGGLSTHGNVNVAGAIEVSCNYFFYEIGRLTGIDRLAYYAKAFGLGQKTGVEIDESIGSLAGPEYWLQVSHEEVAGDTLQASIGQSDHLFTPIQMANYIATLANGGYRREAHLVRYVMSGDYSGMVYEHPGEVVEKIEISEANLKAVKEGMLRVSKSGTARSAFSLYNIPVASKTGTVEVNKNASNNAVFVCFAPYDDPEIAVAIVVEKGSAGSVLAMTAKEIIDYYFSQEGAYDLNSLENVLIR